MGHVGIRSEPNRVEDVGAGAGTDRHSDAMGGFKHTNAVR